MTIRARYIGSFTSSFFDKDNLFGALRAACGGMDTIGAWARELDEKPVIGIDGTYVYLDATFDDDLTYSTLEHGPTDSPINIIMDHLAGDFRRAGWPNIDLDTKEVLS